jgi:ankyrin repeat protein
MPEPKEMIQAVKRGDAALVDALLDADATLITARDKDGSTPLHCAAWKGYPEIVELLIKRGADIHLENQNDHWGGTPLHCAAHGNQKAVAELLIRAGADVNSRSFKGTTPLQETAAHKATAVARLLREHGAVDAPA